MIRKKGILKKMAALVLAACCIAGICGMQVFAETEPASSDAKTETDAAALEDSPEWVSGFKEAAEAGQLFVVAGVGQTTAYVSMHEKTEDGTWKMIMSTPGYIGKKDSSSCPGSQCCGGYLRDAGLTTIRWGRMITGPETAETAIITMRWSA